MLPTQALPIDTSRRRQENALHDQLYPRFVDYYSAHVRNYTLAKELARVAIGKVMTKLPTYDTGKPLENWAIRVARNYLYDYYRQKASRKHQLVQVLSGTGDQQGEDTRTSLVEGFSEANQDYAMLESSLMSQLMDWPGEEGEMVRRHLIMGQEARQIGVELGIADKKVKRVLADARLILQAQLQGEGVED